MVGTGRIHSMNEIKLDFSARLLMAFINVMNLSNRIVIPAIIVIFVIPDIAVHVIAICIALILMKWTFFLFGLANGMQVEVVL